MSRRYFTAIALSTVLLTTLPSCGYNTLQAQDEGVTASWSEVLNQYQRRADLIPNLVSTVKGYAKHEEQVLTEVTAARASVAGIGSSTRANPCLAVSNSALSLNNQAR